MEADAKQFAQGLEALIGKGEKILAAKQTVITETTSDPLIAKHWNIKPRCEERIDCSAGTIWCTEVYLFLANKLPATFVGREELLGWFKYPPTSAGLLEQKIARLRGLRVYVESSGL